MDSVGLTLGQLTSETAAAETQCPFAEPGIVDCEICENMMPAVSPGVPQNDGNSFYHFFHADGVANAFGQRTTVVTFSRSRTILCMLPSD